MLLRGSTRRVSGAVAAVMVSGLLLSACSAAVATSASQAGRTSPSVEAVLAQRAAAVTAHDSAAIAATAARNATPAVRDLGARTATLPLIRWTYAIESNAAGPAAGERSVTAVLHYRLPSDPADVTARRHLVLAPGPLGDWKVVSDDALGAALPWDLGVVAYARGSHSEVLSPASPASPAGSSGTDTDLPAEASAAALAVTGVWGGDWRQTPVVVAVHGPAELAAMTGRSVAGVAGLVAVSTPDRVYLDRVAYSALDPAGQAVLLTHEVTHVATAAGADRADPQWLKEGFADYVGFLHSGIGAHVAAASLLAQVRRTGVPAALPADADFAPGASDSAVADAYAGAWLMCVLIARTEGQPALVSVYRVSAAGTGAPRANLDTALRQVTGRSLAAWTSAWQRDLRRQAG